MDPAMSSDMGTLEGGGEGRAHTTDRYSYGYPEVIPTVDHMSYSPTVYADFDTTPEMSADCVATLRRTPLVAAPAPSLRYEDFPREIAKRDIEVSDAAARLAAALHLHLD